MAGQPSTQSDASGTTSDLRSHAAFIRRFAWFTLLVLVVALGATFLLTQGKERIYSSSARVMLRTPETVSLFPFATTGPRGLLRNPSTELLYVQSAAFTRPATDASPRGASVSTRLVGTDIVFSARGPDAEAVAEAVTLWAQMYVIERQIALDSATQEDIAFINATVDSLEEERSELLEELVSLERLLSQATDPGVTAQILAQKVSVESTLRPQLAPLDAQIAQFQRQLSDFRGLTRFIGPEDVSARVTRTGSVPTSPVSPNLSRNLVVGGALGLALGLGLPYLRRAFDNRVDDRDEVAVTSGLPVLGAIPKVKADKQVKIEVLDRPGSVASEHYQAILTAIEFASIGEPISSVLFTSPSSGDGKTTTATNIAALASQFMNVILIDADMRRPTVHEFVGGTNAIGLSSVLRGTASFLDSRFTFEREGTKFDVLQAGPIPQDPPLLLRGDAWSDLLEDLFLYDLIVVDAPPVLAVTDPLLLGRAVDGQILVSKSGTTTYSQLTQATELLASNGARCLGIVANGERVNRSRYGHYYGTYDSALADDSAEVENRSDRRDGRVDQAGDVPEGDTPQVRSGDVKAEAETADSLVPGEQHSTSSESRTKASVRSEPISDMSDSNKSRTKSKPSKTKSKRSKASSPDGGAQGQSKSARKKACDLQDSDTPASGNLRDAADQAAKHESTTKQQSY